MIKLLLLDYRQLCVCELMLTIREFNLSLIGTPKEEGKAPQEVKAAELVIMRQNLNVIRQSVNILEHK